MPTKIRIQNVEATTRIAGAVANTLVVKQTGGGPAETVELPPGGDLEFTIGDGRKVSVQEQDDEEDDD